MTINVETGMLGSSQERGTPKRRAMSQKSKSEGVGMKDERRAIQPLNSSSLILPPS
jgi:hypothetical protein